MLEIIRCGLHLVALGFDLARAVGFTLPRGIHVDTGLPEDAQGARHGRDLVASAIRY